ncbi:citrulline utilization hydrolase CtlX [Parvularcula lutaonensis]|uniref:Citrulline utilization hydrolase CtlX n=1 Tax=Parvularcula lutaonensis TaxID=491923 RepID=A0ABV7M8I8_9PROT|nr:arginine deiminase-related protein [Parvularcula lutaonensis]GGY44578.1 hypothetical protein GCM10007148_11860 [Parvularcula lutaonensis]
MTSTRTPLSQNPSAVVMVRPDYFGVNAETAPDNRFQTTEAAGDRPKAIAEFDAMKAALRSAGVTVMSFRQEREDTPDAVFPNNWFSTHHSGLIVQYPMLAQSRRRERRRDVFEALAKFHEITGIVDLAGNEEHGAYLEGTGAVVFDHQERVAFMARSQRADTGVLAKLCETLDYVPQVFTAVDRAGVPIYHTNVMMSLGEKTALVGFDSVPYPDELLLLRRRIEATDRLLIELDNDQIAAFAGNALEVDGCDGPVLVISRRAWNSLRRDQQADLERVVAVVTPELSTIEKSGGSARCMMAGIHLPLKKSATA